MFQVNFVALFCEQRHFSISKFKSFNCFHRGAIHYMGLPEQDYFGSQPEVGKQPIAMVPMSTLPERKKYESCPAEADEDDIYEEIDDFPKKAQNGGKENRGMYKFEQSDNCLADEEEEEGTLPTTGSRRIEKVDNC